MASVKLFIRAYRLNHQKILDNRLIGGLLLPTAFNLPPRWGLETSSAFLYVVLKAFPLLLRRDKRQLYNRSFQIRYFAKSQGSSGFLIRFYSLSPSAIMQKLVALRFSLRGPGKAIQSIMFFCPRGAALRQCSHILAPDITIFGFFFGGFLVEKRSLRLQVFILICFGHFGNLYFTFVFSLG